MKTTLRQNSKFHQIHQKLLASKHKTHHMVIQLKFEKGLLSVFKSSKNHLAWKAHCAATAIISVGEMPTICLGEASESSVNQRETTTNHKVKSLRDRVCTTCQLAFITMLRKFGYKDYKSQILKCKWRKIALQRIMEWIHIESSIIYSVDCKFRSILLYSKWKFLKVMDLSKENCKRGSEWIFISCYHGLSTM